MQDATLPCHDTMSTDTHLNVVLGKPVLIDCSHRLYPNVFAKRLVQYNHTNLQALLTTTESGRMAMIMQSK